MKEVKVMKVITKYLCTVCGRTYDSAEDATKCEESHIRIGRIAEKKYELIGKYPTSITIEFLDKACITYTNSLPVPNQGRGPDEN